MKIIKYFLISFFVLSIVDGQEIQKGGETPTSFTYDEALDMLKARDKQWEEKICIKGLEYRIHTIMNQVVAPAGRGRCMKIQEIYFKYNNRFHYFVLD